MLEDRLLRLWCGVSARVCRVRLAQRGATAVEYSILVALIAAIILIVVSSIGEKTTANFESYDSQMP